jgi:hypothetical protein
VLDLDWSGPEPASVTDLGQPAALRLTHHSWTGKLSHLNRDWLLPRGCKVIGAMPPLHARRSTSYSRGWQIGRQLAMQRRWDADDQGPWSDPRKVTCTGAELNEALACPAGSRPDTWSLTVRDVKSLDCALLAALHPDRVPALELLGLHNVPYDYATVMRARWRPQAPNGTLVDITGARKAKWLAENLSNPLSVQTRL